MPPALSFSYSPNDEPPVEVLAELFDPEQADSKRVATANTDARIKGRLRNFYLLDWMADPLTRGYI
jgi:hypothetical protein